MTASFWHGHFHVFPCSSPPGSKWGTRSRTAQGQWAHGKSRSHLHGGVMPLIQHCKLLRTGPSGGRGVVVCRVAHVSHPGQVQAGGYHGRRPVCVEQMLHAHPRSCPHLHMSFRPWMSWLHTWKCSLGQPARPLRAAIGATNCCMYRACKANAGRQSRIVKKRHPSHGTYYRPKELQLQPSLPTNSPELHHHGTRSSQYTSNCLRTHHALPAPISPLRTALLLLPYLHA